MIKTKELFSIVESLPIDVKTQLIDKLIKSLNPSQRATDELWEKESEKRVKEIKTGKVKSIPGEEVFNEIKERLVK